MFKFRFLCDGDVSNKLFNICIPGIPEADAQHVSVTAIEEALKAKFNRYGLSEAAIFDSNATPVFDDQLDISEDGAPLGFLVEIKDTAFFQTITSASGVMPLAQAVKPRAQANTTAQSHSVGGSNCISPPHASAPSAQPPPADALQAQAAPSVAPTLAVSEQAPPQLMQVDASPLQAAGQDDSFDASSPLPTPDGNRGLGTESMATSGKLSQYDCDVFISHAGEDKKGFAGLIMDKFAHMHPRVRVFVDERDLHTGDDADRKITAALYRCSVAVIILSPFFIRKTYPMKELIALLERKQKDGVTLLPVVYGMPFSDTDDVKSKYDKHPWQPWVANPKLKPNESTLTDWADAVKQLMGLTAIRPDQEFWDYETAERIVNEAVQHLREKGKMRENFPTELLPSRGIVGTDQVRKDIKQKLSDEGLLVLHGMPGSGKTTMAKAIYNQLKDNDEFYGCYFAHLEKDMGVNDVMQQQSNMLEYLVPGLGDPKKASGLCSELRDALLTLKQMQAKEEQQEPDAQLQEPSGNVADGADAAGEGDQDAQQPAGQQQQPAPRRKVLLVLDNVWSDSTLQNLLPSNFMGVLPKGSLVLVTSRSETIGSLLCEQGKQPGKFKMPLLDDADSLALFCKHAFELDSIPYQHYRSGRDDEQLTALVTAIVKKCDHLAFALEVSGRYLQRNRARANWQKMVEDWDKMDAKLRSVLREQGGEGMEYSSVFSAIAISYESLSKQQQSSLLDIGLFLKNFPWKQVEQFLDADGRIGGLVGSLDSLQALGLVSKELQLIPDWKHREAFLQEEQEVVSMHGVMVQFCTLYAYEQTKEADDRHCVSARLVRTKDVPGEDAFADIVHGLLVREAVIATSEEAAAKPPSCRILVLENAVVDGPLLQTCRKLQWLSAAYDPWQLLLFLHDRLDLPEYLQVLHDESQESSDRLQSANDEPSGDLLSVMARASLRERITPRAVGSCAMWVCSQIQQNVGWLLRGVEPGVAQLAKMREMLTRVGKDPDCVVQHNIEIALRFAHLIIATRTVSEELSHKLKDSKSWVGMDVQQLLTMFEGLSTFLPSDVCSLLGSAASLYVLRLRGQSPTILQLQKLSELRYLQLSQLWALEKVEGLQNLKQLEVLEIGECHQLTTVEPVGKGCALKELLVHRCHSLKSLDGFAKAAKLRKLWVAHCEQLECVPNLQGLRALEELAVRECPLFVKVVGLARRQSDSGAQHMHVITAAGVTGLQHAQRLRLLVVEQVVLEQVAGSEEAEDCRMDGLPAKLKFGQFAQLTKMKLRGSFTNLHKLASAPLPLDFMQENPQQYTVMNAIISWALLAGKNAD